MHIWARNLETSLGREVRVLILLGRVVAGAWRDTVSALIYKEFQLHYI